MKQKKTTLKKPSAPRATIDVLAIGNAIVDILAEVDEAFIKTHNLNKGTMTLVDAARSQELCELAGMDRAVCGGSAANTVVGLSQMGGRGAYIGKVKNDTFGWQYREDIRRHGVLFTTPATQEGPPTARSAIFVTPDAQRTMNTYLGACVDISVQDIDADLIATASVTYLEGYLFDRPSSRKAFAKAAKIAKKAGRLTAMTLSDPFCVERHRDNFVSFIKSNVDILFANEQEMLSLLGCKTLREAIPWVRQHCQIAALTCGAHGSTVVDGQEVVDVLAVTPQILRDTTGAGDLYAAGFLYGLAQDQPLALCGRLGSAAATAILPLYGPRAHVDMQDLATRTIQAYLSPSPRSSSTHPQEKAS
ncbi:MAG: adenosine kinase [Pseudomonadota bacterium]